MFALAQPLPPGSADIPVVWFENHWYVKLAGDVVFAGGRGVSLDGCADQPNYTWVIDLSDINFLPIDLDLQ